MYTVTHFVHCNRHSLLRQTFPVHETKRSIRAWCRVLWTVWECIHNRWTFICLWCELLHCWSAVDEEVSCSCRLPGSAGRVRNTLVGPNEPGHFLDLESFLSPTAHAARTPFSNAGTRDLFANRLSCHGGSGHSRRPWHFLWPPADLACSGSDYVVYAAQVRP